MTHDELIAYIDDSTDGLKHEDIFPLLLANTQALRAVVELHEPAIVIYPKEMQILMCMECGDEEGLRYPCPTIQAIEKELA
jgi:hypothetical protein